MLLYFALTTLWAGWHASAGRMACLGRPALVRGPYFAHPWTITLQMKFALITEQGNLYKNSLDYFWGSDFFPFLVIHVKTKTVNWFSRTNWLINSYFFWQNLTFAFYFYFQSITIPSILGAETTVKKPEADTIPVHATILSGITILVWNLTNLLL